MTKKNTLQDDEQTKTPFYLTEQNQTTPAGHFSLQDGILVIEFLDNRPEMRITQAQARKTIEFNDSSFIIIPPNEDEEDLTIHLTADGSGRFTVYSIREWSGVDGTEPRAIRKRAFLAKFDSTGAKITAVWQLVLPYVLFGCAYLLHVFATEETLPEIAYFINAWQQIALSPIVAVHYVLLLIPGFALLFYSRMWSLRVMFNMTWVLTAVVAIGSFLPENWLPLPSPSEASLTLPEYWSAFLPYLVLLVLPAFYYINVIRRL